jgi:hypothetical protein
MEYSSVGVQSDIIIKQEPIDEDEHYTSVAQENVSENFVKCF